MRPLPIIPPTLAALALFTALLNAAPPSPAPSAPAVPAPAPPPAPPPDSAPALDWHDVTAWGVEGRAWADEERARWFDRLPASAESQVRSAVWNLSRDSAGMMARFETDASEIWVDYLLRSASLAKPHIPATGVSGVDLYARADEGRWRWVNVTKPARQEVRAALITLVTQIRRAHPTTPIVLVEDRRFTNSWITPAKQAFHDENHAALREAFASLRAEGFKKLHYLPGDNLLGDDSEGATDASHPNDLGFMRQADAFEPVLRKALNQ